MERTRAIVAIGLGTALMLLPDAANGTIVVLDVIVGPIWVAVDGWILVRILDLGRRRGASTTRTLMLAYAAVVAWGALLFPIGVALDRPVDAAAVIGAIAKGAWMSMLVLGVWSLFYVMPRAIRDERERQELQREAERARIRAALEPHFVLNTLTAIAGLVGDDPEKARELLGDVGDLLRDVVRMADRDRQSVADEVAWLQRYARVLEARHDGSLSVTWRVDPAVTGVQIPVLVLQPLVENAIKHGALQRAGGGTVRVELRPVGAALECVIEDDGPGFAGEVRADATGLALARRRLACDAPGSTLAIDSSPRGTRVCVTIPSGSVLAGARDRGRTRDAAAVASRALADRPALPRSGR